MCLDTLAWSARVSLSVAALSHTLLSPCLTPSLSSARAANWDSGSGLGQSDSLAEQLLTPRWHSPLIFESKRIAQQQQKQQPKSAAKESETSETKEKKI